MSALALSAEYQALCTECIREINYFMNKANPEYTPADTLVHQFTLIPTNKKYAKLFNPNWPAYRDVLANYNRVAQAINLRYGLNPGIECYRLPALVGLANAPTLEELKQRNLRRVEVPAPEPQAAPEEAPGYFSEWVAAVSNAASYVGESVASGATTAYSYVPSLPWSATTPEADQPSNNG